MAKSKSKRKISYLFKPADSRNWYVRFQFPGHRVEKSLGTADPKEAEIRALPLIAEHKAKLLAARARLETVWVHQYEPGREHAAPDGGRIIATDRELIYLNHNGAITQTA